MGQIASSANDGKNNAILELFSKEQIMDLLSSRCLTLLRNVEITSITNKLNVTSLREKNVVTPTDLALLLQLSNDMDRDNSSVNESFNRALKILYESTRVIGSLPFLSNYTKTDTSGGLTIQELLISSLVHSARYKKIFNSQYDYLKLIFCSLALPRLAVETNSEELSVDFLSDKPKVVEQVVPEPYVVEVRYPIREEDSPDIRLKKVKWDTFNIINNYDDIDISSLKVNAYDLVQIITLFLIISSIPKMKRDLMHQKLVGYIERWKEFEVYGLYILKYININLNATNLQTETITFEEFQTTFNRCLPNFFQNGFSILFKEGLLSTVVAKAGSNNSSKDIPNNPEPQKQEEEATKKKKFKLPKFEESKLVNAASLSYISNVVSGLGSSIEISNQNLIKLYAGTEAGFSIRSLELKIFKWQAPTLFVVSGKRLKNKTIDTNMRYQQFKTEYPQYFRSLESNKHDWQNDNDKITYAILINQPWKNSNKKNFGDENTIILSLLPRLDFYKSIHSTVLNGELIYFNTLGLGIGFGNTQPVNKNGVKKYFPGDVSLTIEANLEFAVFRHIVALSANTSTYFERSHQSQVRSSDFEDRFMITDLEVWGIGSTKDLEEQRKQWEWEQKQAEARQSVNLRSLGEERAFLEMVGLVGNHNSSGGSI